MITRAVHLAAVTLFVTVTVFAGCAKRPAMTQASAPPPATAPAPMAAKPAPPPPPVVVQETVKETVTVTPMPAPAPPAPPPTAAAAQPAPTTRPAPKEFAVNANVNDIFFDFDKYTIRPNDAKVLDANAAWLKANPGQLVLIEGHCDERGTVEYNLALGERRAKAAMNYLVAQGVQASRFTVISYGKERPFCRESNEACWSQNRRDHFLVKAQ
ncbi:MAG: peptidoglycan-associated lipoprotein Pal [Candidatus Rokuibacteriota bacterium]